MKYIFYIVKSKSRWKAHNICHDFLIAFKGIVPTRKEGKDIKAEKGSGITVSHREVLCFFTHCLYLLAFKEINLITEITRTMIKRINTFGASISISGCC